MTVCLASGGVLRRALEAFEAHAVQGVMDAVLSFEAVEMADLEVCGAEGTVGKFINPTLFHRLIGQCMSQFKTQMNRLAEDIHMKLRWVEWGLV